MEYYSTLREKINLYDTGTSQKYYAKWNKPKPKDYLLGFHLYDISKKVKSRDESWLVTASD